MNSNILVTDKIDCFNYIPLLYLIFKVLLPT